MGWESSDEDEVDKGDGKVSGKVRDEDRVDRVDRVDGRDWVMWVLVQVWKCFVGVVEFIGVFR